MNRRNFVPSEFGQWVATCRSAKGWTHEHLAYCAQMTVEDLESLESGTTIELPKKQRSLIELAFSRYPAFSPPPRPETVQIESPRVTSLHSVQSSISSGVSAASADLSIIHLLELTPTEFEDLTVQLFIALGYTDVKRSGGAGDLNADVTATDQFGRPTIVQCKRYALGNQVGSPVVQTFIGMMSVHHKAQRGSIVTTSSFCIPAARLAREHNIDFIDGDDCLRLLALTGVRHPRHLRQAVSSNSEMKRIASTIDISAAPPVATVASADEFREWLLATRSAKGLSPEALGHSAGVLPEVVLAIKS